MRDEIITNIAHKKQKWLNKRAADRAIEITTSYRRQLDWKKNQQDCIEIATG